ncbi:MAG: hypothetical protein RL189_796 [Pseudomonadota bacterium]|jgi:hypothetical protein
MGTLLLFALLCLTTAVLSPFFMTPFSYSQVRMRASPLETRDGLGFVTYLSDVQDMSGERMKRMFGWGGLDLVSRAAQALAPHLQKCRALIQPAGKSNDAIFKFSVLVDVAKPGFTVSQLLEGHEADPDTATCLRDRINGLEIADFAQLRAAEPKNYKLHLGVQLAHGSDGGSP